MAGPDVWGPYLWTSLHFIALAYPNNPSKYDRELYYNYITNFASVIPCGICAHHFKQNLVSHPLKGKALSGKLNLFNWSVDMHNEVNKKHGKHIYTYEEALDDLLNKKPTSSTTVERFTTTSTPFYKNPYIYIIVFLLFVIFMLVLKK